MPQCKTDPFGEAAKLALCERELGATSIAVEDRIFSGRALIYASGQPSAEKAKPVVLYQIRS